MKRGPPRRFASDFSKMRRSCQKARVRASAAGKSTTGGTFSKRVRDVGRISYHPRSVADYLSAGMRLYLERLTDWSTLLRLRKGDSGDVEAEVGAYRSVLETTAAIAADLEQAAREHWAEEGELSAD